MLQRVWPYTFSPSFARIHTEAAAVAVAVVVVLVELARRHTTFMYLQRSNRIEHFLNNI